MDRARRPILGLHVWALTKHSRSCVGIMSLCIVWRGAMALIIASMSRGSTLLFHLELGYQQFTALQTGTRATGRGRRSVYVCVCVCVQVTRGK